MDKAAVRVERGMLITATGLALMPYVNPVVPFKEHTAQFIVRVTF